MHFNNLFSNDKLSYLAGAQDALTAKIVGDLGFDGVWSSGLGISATHGVPDMSILSMNEFLSSSKYMAEASSAPVICDCDAGFGNIHNVAWMVKEYERAGVAGICIEDKRHPKLNSFINKSQQCESVEDFSSKIKVAKYTRKSSDFALIARCESLIAGLGMDEALMRSCEYVKAGADAILIHSKSSDPTEILTFAKEWNKRAPLIVIPTTYPSLEINDSLCDLGITTVIFANQALRASVSAIQSCLKDIIDKKSSLDLEDQISSVKDVFKLQGLERINEIEERFIAK